HRKSRSHSSYRLHSRICFSFVLGYHKKPKYYLISPFFFVPSIAVSHHQNSFSKFQRVILQKNFLHLLFYHFHDKKHSIHPDQFLAQKHQKNSKKITLLYNYITLIFFLKKRGYYYY